MPHNGPDISPRNITNTRGCKKPLLQMRGNYGRGSSYARRGQHYVRGHYSRDDGRDSLIERMEDIMRGADSKDRESIQRCIDMMRNS